MTDELTLAQRTQPHSPDLERAVLAALLDGTRVTAIHTVRQYLAHPLAFFVRNHRMVYQACLDLDDQGARIDATAVADWLGRMRFRAALERLRRLQALVEHDPALGQDKNRLRQLWRWRDEDAASDPDDSALAAIGGFAALGELMTVFSPSAGLERSAQLIHDYHCKRRYIASLSALVDRAYQTTDDFTALVDLGSQSLLGLGLGSGAGVRSMVSVTDETMDRIGEAMHNPHAGLSTGWSDLDERVMSLRPGGLYILAARPGAGKTSFALNLVEHVVGTLGAQALFVSLEVDAVDLVKKLISARSKVAFSKLEMGTLDDAEMAALTDASQEVKGWPLSLLDISDCTVHQLRSQVKRLMLEKQGQLRLVVIDYLQLLSSTDPRQSEYEKISEISRTLKMIAKDCKIPIVALSQLSRESDKGQKPGPPRLSHLRGSGSIEQDADAVIFLYRVNEEDDSSEREMKVILAKNRFGPLADIPMIFYAGRQRFVQMGKAQQQGPTLEEIAARVNAQGTSAADEDEDPFR